MHVAFRVDASVQIGSGHVMRCLTLADRLRKKGATVRFVCRETEGHLNDLIAARGYAVHRLASATSWGTDVDLERTAAVLTQMGREVDWLIVDHYALDEHWETGLRRFAAGIMVIDDLADRNHDCDLLLDQNFYEGMESRYNTLVPQACRKFLGPRYALLREEFTDARSRLKRRDGTINSVLIFFGGADRDNETAKALTGLGMLGHDRLVADVVIGTQNPHRRDVEQLCRMVPRVRFHCQVDNMARLMADADLFVGAGGATTWERCFLGLPTLTVATADNQLRTTLDLEAAGVIWYLGRAQDLRPADYAAGIAAATADPDEVRRKSDASMRLVGPGPSGEEDPLTLALVSGIPTPPIDSKRAEPHPRGRNR